MSKPSRKIQNALNTISKREQWEFVEKKLYVHAISKVKYTAKGGTKIWKGIPSNKLPAIELKDMAEEFVSEAILKLFSGERKTWDTQEPLAESVIRYLMGVIDSLVNAKLTSPENQKTLQDRGFEDNDKEGSGSTPLEQIPDSSETPEEVLMTTEENIRQSKLVEDFLLFMKKEDEPLIVQIVELGKDYIFDLSEIAKKIGCTTNDLRNAKKRAARRLHAFRKKWKM